MSNDMFATSSNLPDGMTFADLSGYFDEIDIEPPGDDYGDCDDYDGANDDDDSDDGEYGMENFEEEDE